MPTSLDVHEGSINSQWVVTFVITGTAFIGRRAAGLHYNGEFSNLVSYFGGLHS
jgi:hypothetical protein